MSKTSYATLEKVAMSVRSYITPFIAEKGFVTNEELVDLIKKHSPHKVASVRSIGLVQEFLCDC